MVLEVWSGSFKPIYGFSWAPRLDSKLLFNGSCPLRADAFGSAARGTPHRGITPSLAGGGPAGAARGDRGAPARGVDVKPLRQGPEKGPKRPKTPKKGVYPPKRPFLAILAKNR